MTKSDVQEALDRVLHWPPERQEDAVELLKLIEEHDSSPLGLSEEQAAEVRERLAEEQPETLTLNELDQRLRRLGL